MIVARLIQVAETLERNNKYCREPRCRNTTGDGKLYCLGHLMEQPMLSSILDRLAQQEAEVNIVLKYGTIAVRMDHLIIQDILAELLDGPQEIEELSENLDVSPDAINFYILFLERQKKVTFDPRKMKTLEDKVRAYESQSVRTSA